MSTSFNRKIKVSSSGLREESEGCSEDEELTILQGSSTSNLTIEFKCDYFVAGDSVHGLVLLNLLEPFDISGIYLQFQGYERVRFRQRANSIEESGSCSRGGSDADDFTRSNSFRRNSKTINTAIPTRLPISQPHFLQAILITQTIPITRYRGYLQKGLHSFPFTIPLPTKLPTSLNFSSGSTFLAEILYEVTVQVFRPPPRIHLSITVPIKINSSLANHNHRAARILSSIDQTIPMEHIFAASCYSCFFPNMEVNFFASWKRNVYNPGDVVEIDVLLVALNTTASCSLNLMSVKLVRELVIKVDEHSFRQVHPIEKSKFLFGNNNKDNLKISSTEIQLSSTISVPSDLVPTTQTTAIICKYFLVFELKLRWHKNVLVASEIFIQ